ncbi:MAG: hypothetical protein R6W68_00175 [Ignavibacteriaceae bacterium]
MALKKPKNIPKISKAREKSIDKLKDSTPVKKESEIEFNCRMFFHRDSRKGNQKYRFTIETIRQFSFMNYEVTTKANKTKKNIDISIIGLTAKDDFVSKAQPAYANVDFEELYGEYTINIIKQDGSINSAVVDFNIFKKEIKLVQTFLPEKENNRTFCTFEVDDSMHTYSSEFMK